MSRLVTSTHLILNLGFVIEVCAGIRIKTSKCIMLVVTMNKGFKCNLCSEEMNSLYKLNVQTERQHTGGHISSFDQESRDLEVPVLIKNILC